MMIKVSIQLTQILIFQCLAYITYSFSFQNFVSQITCQYLYKSDYYKRITTFRKVKMIQVRKLISTLTQCHFIVTGRGPDFSPVMMNVCPLNEAPCFEYMQQLKIPSTSLVECYIRYRSKKLGNYSTIPPQKGPLQIWFIFARVI